MVPIDRYSAAKRTAADEVERVGPVRMLRASLDDDPATFRTLVLAAVGPLEAARLGPDPTDEELAWIGRELLGLLRDEGDDD